MPETIKGMDELRRKLKKLENPDRPVKRGLRNYYQDIQGRIERYAPLSPANRPPAPYYVRGQGTFTGRKNMRNSQKMDKKWARPEYNKTARGYELVIKNTATYSGYVIGERQQWYHSLRGWIRADKYVDNTAHKAVGLIKAEIDRELER